MPIEAMTKAVGVDLGTSTIKLVSGNYKYKIPSVIGTPNPGWTGMSTDKSWLTILVCSMVHSMMSTGILRPGMVASFSTWV